MASCTSCMLPRCTSAFGGTGFASDPQKQALLQVRHRSVQPLLCCWATLAYTFAKSQSCMGHTSVCQAEFLAGKISRSGLLADGIQVWHSCCISCSAILPDSTSSSHCCHSLSACPPWLQGVQGL